MQGVYTGFCATLLRDIPFSMIYFPAYAVVRAVMAQSFLKPGEEPTFGQYFKNDEKFTSFSAMNFASGLASGLIGALAVTPMDCIKTRIQKSGGISWMQAANAILAEGRAQGGNSAAIQAEYHSFDFSQNLLEIYSSTSLMVVTHN